MPSINLTAARGGDFGAKCRALARAIEAAVADIPDNNPSGASSVLTITDGANFATVQVTAGPFQHKQGGGIAPGTKPRPPVRV